jgi:hypothetical protein
MPQPRHLTFLLYKVDFAGSLFPRKWVGGSIPTKGGLKDMAEVLSKNARVGIVTQKFFCSCGGEIKMKLVFNKGKLRNTAECEKCHKQERKPSDFKA